MPATTQADRPTGQFLCKCSHTIRAQVPVRIATNCQEYSMVMFPHEVPVTCEKCGSKYTFVMQEFEAYWVLLPILEEATIVPATSMPPPGSMPN